MKSGFAAEQTPFSGPELTPASKAHLNGMIGHLEAALDARGYFRPAAKKPKMLDNLRAVLTRPTFTVEEIKLLRGIISSLDYFSPKTPRGAGYPERKAKADRDTHGEADETVKDEGR
jgi:tRNA/rRNA methyltransferase